MFMMLALLEMSPPGKTTGHHLLLVVVISPGYSELREIAAWCS